MSKNTPKTWFVTGASKGIGLSLVKHLLANGHRVVATSRSVEAFNGGLIDIAHDRFLPLAVDLTSETSVAEAIQLTVGAFGSIDVVVNNAGYGQQGTIEGLSDAELRSSFDVNVMAPLHVIRHALPYMRQRKSGHIINISSIVGFNGGYAGWGCYVSTKFALAGMTESLAAEVKEFGIKATVVYPGPIRTDFLSSGSLVVAKRQLPEYTEAQASLDLHLNEMDGRQAGDPERVAAALLQLAEDANPPVHLFLGKIAVELAHAKMASVSEELSEWEDTSKGADFPI
ncbi:SDR family NAD(P)-dependent oxidoreductase [Pseudomonas aeruginosa]|uniref:SDR family NAD(P)-dependent oxidoreductase n=1 Tax=Pseudomonas aeruginosa TaxID=287 RepID=UPI000EAFF65E|nr:SDR family NAD(P)-dependent oxidoreductase [Pseudomonas aeruginosa]RTV63327.1 SDR family NAD(P)-dependent oxidoreductase [Pseudomonas aeruginosa]